jgi:hypothetical protein
MVEVVTTRVDRRIDCSGEDSQREQEGFSPMSTKLRLVCMANNAIDPSSWAILAKRTGYKAEWMVGKITFVCPEDQAVPTSFIVTFPDRWLEIPTQCGPFETIQDALMHLNKFAPTIDAWLERLQLVSK